VLRIGVDVGGTFTDFAGVEEGRPPRDIVSLKVPSTPPTFIEGFHEGLDRLIAKMGLTRDTEAVLMHGTTIGVNTVIERSGPKIALLTTEGFRDILELQRLRLNDTYNFFADRTVPLVPRNLVYEIPERLAPTGQVLTPLSPHAVLSAAKDALGNGAEALAIAFLHSYRNAEHETAARDHLRAMLGEDLAISISSELWPQIGEYERATIATLNAYTMGKMDTYLGQVENYLAAVLPKARLMVTRSNGGAAVGAEARRAPVYTLLSGPASGVTAATFMAKQLPDKRSLLTMDMGGTSADISLILNGLPQTSEQSMVGDFPLMMPVTAVEAVGAGGGSIAKMDNGVLRVGPESAGANPGPACFGRGGDRPTITDSYLLCGYLDADRFLGGEMPLDRSKSERAMAPIAQALGTDVAGAADACIAVATSNMMANVLPFLSRQGVDAAELCLVAFGGNGGLHGTLLAEDLGIRQVLVPSRSSVFCAFGGLVAEMVHDTIDVVRGAQLTVADIRTRYEELEEQARSWLLDTFDEQALSEVHVERWASMRYAGQSFDIAVPLSGGALGVDDLSAVYADFHREHERLYGHADPTARINIVELRVRIRGELPTLDSHIQESSETVAASEPRTRRTIRVGGKEHPEAGIYDWESLRAGQTIVGPALIERPETTVLVPPRYLAGVQSSGDVLLTQEA
jgi:N-methylhydantoinase A